MDRRLKERLIGATILVALIVLIVPELLSGPQRTPPGPAAPAGGAAEIMRNVTVDLATSQAAADDRALASTSPAPPPAAPGGADPPPAAPADADPWAPADSTALREQPPATHALENDAPAPTGNPGGARATAAPGAHRTWVVQIGSFVSRANADQQARRLQAHERLVRVSSSGKGVSLRYRVSLGPFADRAAAEQAIRRLRKDGLSASLIPP